MPLTLPRTRGITSGRAVVNWAHPLARGLVFLTYPGGSLQHELVSGNRGTVFGGGNWRGRMPSGHSFLAPSSGTDGVFWQPSNRLYGVTCNMTCMTRADIAGIATNGGRLLVVPYASTGAFNSFVVGKQPTSTLGRLDFADSASTSQTSSTSTVFLSSNDRLTTYGISRTGTDVFFTRNQTQLIAGNVTNANIAWGDNQPVHLFNTPQNLVSGTRGVVDFIAVWNRGLTLAEMQQVWANPYLLVQSVPVVFGLAATPTNGSTGVIATTIPTPAVSIAARVVNTGTIAASLPSPTVSGTARTVSRGAIATAIPTPAVSISGRTVNRGTIATTLPAPQVVAQARTVSRGAITSTLPSPTVAATATTVATGAIAVNLPAPVVTVQGRAVNTGVITASLPAPTVAVQGQTISMCAITTTLPVPTIAVAATTVGRGEIVASLPTPAVQAQAVSVNRGVIVTTLPSPQVYVWQTSGEGTTGQITATIPTPAVSIVARTVNVGAIAVLLPALGLSAVGRTVSVGAINVSLPSPTVSIASHRVARGAIIVTLPSVSVAIAGNTVTPGIATGAIVITLPMPAVVATGRVVAVGTLLVTLPSPRLIALLPTSNTQTPRSRWITIAVDLRTISVRADDRVILVPENVSKFLPLKQKTADAELDYRIDWSQYLARDGDTLIDSEWVLPAGLNLVAGKPPTFTPQFATVWLVGGIPRTTYTVINRVKTANGRTDGRGFKLAIVDYSI